MAVDGRTTRGDIISSTLTPSTRRRVLIAAAIVGGLVALCVVVLGVLWVVQRGEALPNTSVAGVDVSGMDADDITRAVEPITQERQDTVVEFELEGESHVLTTDEVGYDIDVEATTAMALRRGRTGLPGDIVTRLRSLRRSENFPLQRRLDDEALRDRVDTLADLLDRDEVRGDVEIDPDTLDVTSVTPQGSVEVDRGRAVEVAREAFLRGDGHRGELPADTTEDPIAPAEVEAVTEQVRDAIDERLELSANGEALTLEPSDVARLIEVSEASGGQTGTTLELTVSDDRVEEVLGEIARGRFDSDPVDASYGASRTPPARFDAQSSATYRPVSATVEVVGGRDGRRFASERAAEQLTELLREGAHEAELELERVSADLSNDEARDLRPTHAIGTFTTYYQAGQIRNQNIQHLADVVDGTLVLPGEQFSINEISGPRTCERGYEPAGTIVAGELTDTCGGGTSQFGTTTFNAAFFAGVQLDQWKAHSWYISRYPMGREATLSYPVLDVKFTNTTAGAILVKTSHTSTSVTVTLYGQPIADAVTASHGSPTNYRDFDEEIRETSQMTRGQERVEQGGSRGFQVRVIRTMSLVDGGERTRTINTTYSPQTRIVTRGTAPPPSAPDEDDDQNADQNAEADDEAEES